MIWGNTESRVTSGYVEFRNGRFRLVPLFSGPAAKRILVPFDATVWVSLCFIIVNKHKAKFLADYLKS